jgi:hypothetical protein
MKMRRRSAGLSAALLVVAAAFTLTGPVGIAAGGGERAETAAPGKQPLLISNCRKPRFEPKKVVLACGDAGLIAQSLEWSRWNQKGATGTGTGVAETCNPDCATGGVARADIQLVLSKPAKCKGGTRLFTKIRYSWPSGAPQGIRADTITLGCRVLGGGIP